MVVTAFLVLTTTCDRACPWCFYEVDPACPRTREGLDPDQALRLVEDLARAGVRVLILTGGEPTLRGDLEAVVARASRQGLHTVLLTHGRTLDRRRVHQLGQAGLGALTVSWTDGGPEEEQAARILTEEGSFPVSAIHVVTPTSPVERVLALERRTRIPVLLQPAWHPSGTVPPNQVVEGWARARGMERWVGLWRRTAAGLGPGPTACGMGTATAVLDADGTVLPCFHRRDLPAGNALLEPVGPLLERLARQSAPLRSAPCFGRACLSLHVQPHD